MPQPRWWVVGARPTSRRDVDGPVVVKAPDRQGQKGLTLVDAAADLPAAIDDGAGAARNGLALVEELVDGPEVTVVGFSAAGSFTRACSSRTGSSPSRPRSGSRSHTSGRATTDGQALDVAERAVAALGIENGPSYTQLRLGADGPQVIEVAARLGGGHDAELVEAVTGVDLNGLAIDAALGTDLVPARHDRRVGGAATRFLIAPAGRARAVDVPDGLEGVERVRIYREPGHVFTAASPRLRPGGAVLASAIARAGRRARGRFAAERIRFVTADAGALV